MNTNTVWTRKQLVDAYPELVEVPRSFGLRAWNISECDVPEEFRALIPYAELWGVGDDGVRGELVSNAPMLARDNLIRVVRPADGRLDPWLTGSEASGPEFSDAYVAFSCLRMAADSAEYAARRRL